MAALPAVPKVVRVDFHFTFSTDPNVQVRDFFQYTGALSTADAQTWLANIRAGWDSNMMTLLSNELTLVQTVLTDLTSNTAAQVVDTTGVAGTSASAPASAGTCMVIRKKIARRYRGGHPRIYIPGLVASSLSTATAWTAGAVAAAKAGYDAYITAATANTNPAAIGVITHVNVSYFSGFTNKTFPSGRTHPVPTPRGTPVVDLIVGTAGVVAPGSQRRRN